MEHLSANLASDEYGKLKKRDGKLSTSDAFSIEQKHPCRQQMAKFPTPILKKASWQTFAPLHSAIEFHLRSVFGILFTLNICMKGNKTPCIALYPQHAAWSNGTHVCKPCIWTLYQALYPCIRIWQTEENVVWKGGKVAC
ncbi:hypothetical protein CDAR_281311 [Caerostris darwini]|uniref:Uncharacterized protein n=1 Tax=Caerostris darwini TaxID=1538125 RepID=A0AAV4WV72_9ARAC|nr:hypothetical protein CDAR_281311 [Caerostris darwini]